MPTDEMPDEAQINDVDELGYIAPEPVDPMADPEAQMPEPEPPYVPDPDPADGTVVSDFDRDFPKPYDEDGRPYTYVGNGVDPLLLKGPVALRNPDGTGSIKRMQVIIDPYTKIHFGDDYWIFIYDKSGSGQWIRIVDQKIYNDIYSKSTHPTWRPSLQSEFANRIDTILTEQYDPAPIQEGMILSIDKLISDTIRVPEGEYVVAAVNATKCMLVPTSESHKQKFEVFKKTLAGFFNPEIHRKKIDKSNEPTITETTR